MADAVRKDFQDVSVLYVSKNQGKMPWMAGGLSITLNLRAGEAGNHKKMLCIFNCLISSENAI